jgi:hypothetical protein
MRVWHFVDLGMRMHCCGLQLSQLLYVLVGLSCVSVWSAKLSLVGALDMLRDTSAACVVVDVGMQPCPSGD